MSNKNTRKKAVAIKIALLDKGVRQSQIARALGVSGSAVSLYISGRSTSKRFDIYLKDTLGIDVNTLPETVHVD